MSADEAERIVRVLTYQRGFTDLEPDIAEDLLAISRRYNELKKTTDFMSASIQAKAEWLLTKTQP